jgi:hypothetical protein
MPKKDSYGFYIIDKSTIGLSNFNFYLKNNLEKLRIEITSLLNKINKAKISGIEPFFQFNPNIKIYSMNLISEFNNIFGNIGPQEFIGSDNIKKIRNINNEILDKHNEKNLDSALLATVIRLIDETLLSIELGITIPEFKLHTQHCLNSDNERYIRGELEKLLTPSETLVALKVRVNHLDNSFEKQIDPLRFYWTKCLIIFNSASKKYYISTDIEPFIKNFNNTNLNDIKSKWLKCKIETKEEIEPKVMNIEPGFPSLFRKKGLPRLEHKQIVFLRKIFDSLDKRFNFQQFDSIKSKISPPGMEITPGMEIEGFFITLVCIKLENNHLEITIGDSFFGNDNCGVLLKNKEEY